MVSFYDFTLIFATDFTFTPNSLRHNETIDFGKKSHQNWTGELQVI